jgi:hypothetical protein
METSSINISFLTYIKFCSAQTHTCYLRYPYKIQLTWEVPQISHPKAYWRIMSIKRFKIPYLEHKISNDTVKFQGNIFILHTKL